MIKKMIIVCLLQQLMYPMQPMTSATAMRQFNEESNQLYDKAPSLLVSWQLSDAKRAARNSQYANYTCLAMMVGVGVLALRNAAEGDISSTALSLLVETGLFYSKKYFQNENDFWNKKLSTLNVQYARKKMGIAAAKPLSDQIGSRIDDIQVEKTK